MDAFRSYAGYVGQRMSCWPTRLCQLAGYFVSGRSGLMRRAIAFWTSVRIAIRLIEKGYFDMMAVWYMMSGSCAITPSSTMVAGRYS